MAELVYFGKIHAISKLQAGDLSRVELYLKICLQDGDMNGLTLGRIRALGTDTVKFHVPVMRFYEFIYDRVHGVRLF